MKTRRVRIQHGGIEIIHPITNDVNDYTGPRQHNGQPQGHGKMTYDDGTVYEGDFKDGLANGRGKCEFADGNVYEGEFENDLMHGRGKMTYADGNVYEGNWLNNEMTNGVLTFADGNVYEGEFDNGQRQGRGKMTYGDGDVCEGNWLNNAMTNGVMTYADGTVYEGEWTNHAKNGHGKMTYANGDVYVGPWHYDNRHGAGGIMTYANRDVYVGNWLNNYMHGQGTYTYADGTVYDGNWINNDMHGQGVYEGELEDGLANGHGKCRFINGNVYEGGWSADYCHGQGRMTYANGDVYVGPWHYNNRHGETGKLTYADGRVYEGEWWRDNMSGDGKIADASGNVIYEGLWRNNRQNPHFFDPATGKLADNDGYNPPAPIMRFPNSDNMLYRSDRFKHQYKFNDMIYNDEKNVVDELEEDPTMIALKLYRTYYILSKENIIGLMNDKRFIRYECRRIDTAEDPPFSIDADVNKTVPYFGLNGIVSDQGGVVLLFDLWAAINSGHNAYEFVKTGRKLLTVASHHVAYGYGSWVGSAHCQHDKDADIYELRKLRIAERPRPHKKTRKNGSHRSHTH